MSDTLLRLYHRLPAPMRSVASSVRGHRLTSWRYGPETDQLIEAAVERESWDLTQWKVWQEERLSYILQRAATRVPYYRDLWAERRRRGDCASWSYLENWPVLTKEVLRENSARFVAEDCHLRKMYHERTSGTTGKPLDLWWSLETVRAWFALFETRTRHWNGVSRHDRWAILGGQPVVPANAKRPPFWVVNTPMNQLYLSANHLSQQNIPAYVNALKNHGPTHLVAYSSSVSLFARHVRELDLRVPGLKVVITNAEPLFPWQRDIIRKGLECNVQETYGMAEIVAAASECAHATLHVWPEVGLMEVLSDFEDMPQARGEAGRLICTTLLNADMPLIRYAVGDRGRGAAPPESEVCECGRMLPALSPVEGRTNDLLLTKDGRSVYWLNPVFYGLPIREGQIIQESLTHVRVRFVPASNFTAKAGQTIVERMKMRMGEVEVLLEEVEQVPKGANGKFRAVICNLTPEQKRAALGRSG